MKIVEFDDRDFDSEFKKILKQSEVDSQNVSQIVQNIISNVKQNKDEALKEDIKKFDNWQPNSIEDIKISLHDMKKAYDNLDKELKKALLLAYDRIEAFHKKQLPKSWMSYEKNGNILGQKVTPVDRAGLYIPGGKAAYPSSLLMNAIPAIVAGVKEIIVSTPTPDGEINELLLATLHLCKIKKAYKIGGASAIAAMAYGTKSIPKVDIITGPGNIFVATAKKMLYGEVNIDMIAGPSEIVVLANEDADKKLVAIDLLSQAEHDELASAILVTTSKEFAKEVKKQIYTELKSLNRSQIATKSIKERGAIIVAKDLEHTLEIINALAPEHLELMVENPFELLPKIKHAGAIFLGKNTPEAIGDYIAGPNHTLPTSKTAKFYSPLGVENFLKKSSIIYMSQEGIESLASPCALLAKTEGLDAHQKSVEYRQK